MDYEKKMKELTSKKRLVTKNMIKCHQNLEFMLHGQT
jgi:hypothetical protein